MTSSRLWDRRATRRLAAVDGYVFPSSVRQRFAFTHPDLSRENLDAVEAAVRQWFRLAARQPRAKLTMPSVLAGDYWREFRLDTAAYGTFCAQVVGRPVQDDPADDRGVRLVTTFRLAQQDEGTASHELPRLFRVDRDLAISGARRYLADCGGYEHCYDNEVDVICLRHLAGPPRRRRGGTWNHLGAPGTATYGGDSGFGCGGGCGGGGP
jgi:hypothetical protein